MGQRTQVGSRCLSVPWAAKQVAWESLGAAVRGGFFEQVVQASLRSPSACGSLRSSHLTARPAPAPPLSVPIYSVGMGPGALPSEGPGREAV